MLVLGLYEIGIVGYQFYAIKFSAFVQYTNYDIDTEVHFICNSLKSERMVA